MSFSTGYFASPQKLTDICRVVLNALALLRLGHSRRFDSMKTQKTSRASGQCTWRWCRKRQARRVLYTMCWELLLMIVPKARELLARSQEAKVKHKRMTNSLSPVPTSTSETPYLPRPECVCFRQPPACCCRVCIIVMKVVTETRRRLFQMCGCVYGVCPMNLVFEDVIRKWYKIKSS